MARNKPMTALYSRVGRPRNERRYRQVAKMRRDGMSVNQIRRKLKITRQSVYYLLNRAEESAKRPA